jgi:hypothetical protein
MIEKLHDAAERFFGLPEEQKMKFYIGNSPVCLHATLKKG